MHFLNPVSAGRPCEIVRGMKTSDETYERVKAFASRIGKTPVEVFEYPGFITTRTILPMLNEAMHLLMEGNAKADAIDTAMRLGYGMQNGPLEMADTMGLDEVLMWMETLYHELGEPRFRPCPLLRRMVREGRLGKKMGEGFSVTMKMVNEYDEHSRFELRQLLCEVSTHRSRNRKDPGAWQCGTGGMNGATLTNRRHDGDEIKIAGEIVDHTAAIEYILAVLLSKNHGVIGDKSEIQAVGHRVVHGGETFSDSALITSEVIKALQDTIELAPLHNPHNLRGITACQVQLPGIPQVAVFDTAFHQKMPKKAYLYGLPYSLYLQYKIRRYVFMAPHTAMSQPGQRRS